jgi:predicted secreted Zn-dependent protease
VVKYLIAGLVALILAASSQSASADWQAVEKIDPYLISGTTPPELYASIGDKGPKLLGTSSAIAHTNFKLTWTRKYQATDAGCSIVVARPKLIITSTLPKPSQKLPPDTQRRWDRFITGVEAHERVHGDMIKDLVRKIEAVSLGMTVPDDPKCSKIRAQLTQRLAQLSQEQRQRSRDFDRLEMSNGGNIHQLILQLLNP